MKVPTGEACLLAENVLLREALEAAAHWHDSERKALGKQPPSTDRDWRRTQHALQAEEIRSALATEGEAIR